MENVGNNCNLRIRTAILLPIDKNTSPVLTVFALVSAVAFHCVLRKKCDK